MLGQQLLANSRQTCRLYRACPIFETVTEFMTARIPDTDSEINLKIPRKKSDTAGYIELQPVQSATIDGMCRYWPATRMSILEGLQNDAVDQEIWERFVDLYGPLICAFCRKRVPDQDAKEITQEVFWRVFRYVKGLRYDPSIGSFGGWIGQITRNEIKDHFERKQKESSGQLGADVLRQIEARTTLGEWEDEYHEWVAMRAMRQVRAEVSPVTWDLFETTMNGATPKEAARRHSVKISAVYKARWAVADRLRKLIRAMSDDYPFSDQK